MLNCDKLHSMAGPSALKLHSYITATQLRYRYIIHIPTTPTQCTTPHHKITAVPEAEIQALQLTARQQSLVHIGNNTVQCRCSGVWMKLKSWQSRCPIYNYLIPQYNITIIISITFLIKQWLFNSLHTPLCKILLALFKILMNKLNSGTFICLWKFF